jgi:alpha-beta hydrolase superfamily lysophospholipase
MAMAEARRRSGGHLPVQLVGYSNGGALALLHRPATHRTRRAQRRRSHRAVVADDRGQRLRAVPQPRGPAGVFRPLSPVRWLDLLPEYNPFKYNSFPVRAARESYLVTSELQDAIASVAQQGTLDKVPPILAFQSVVDDTVTAQAVMTRLFDALPANGSELVLFDVNHSRILDPSCARPQPMVAATRCKARRAITR